MTRTLTVTLTEPQARRLFEAAVAGHLDLTEGSETWTHAESAVLDRGLAALVDAYRDAFPGRSIVTGERR